MDIAIQTLCQEGTALYCLVHQLCLPHLFHGEGDTRITWNYFKTSDGVHRTMRKMWVQCCHLNDGTLLALLSIMTCCQMPNLFLQIDCHPSTLVLPLACRCQHTVPSRMDIPSITATYPIYWLCHSQNGQNQRQVILWKLKFFVLSTMHRYSETNVMHFLFILLRIKGLYMFQALLAHPQESLHKQHLVYCVHVMSVGCTRIDVPL
jgi:hypothetical protein